MYWDNMMREIRLAIVFTLYVGYGRHYSVVRRVSCAKAAGNHAHGPGFLFCAFWHGTDLRRKLIVTIFYDY